MIEVLLKCHILSQSIKSSCLEQLNKSEIIFKMDGEQFSVQVMCYRLLGFPRARDIKFAKIYMILHSIRTFVAIFGIIFEVNFVVENFQDVLPAAECFAPLSTQIITFVKLATLTLLKENLYEMMDQIKALRNDISIGDSLNLKRVNQFDKNVAAIYLASTVFTGSFMCIAPISTDLINYWIYGIEFSRELPTKFAIFFIDVTLSPAYELSYLTLCVATYITVLTCVRNGDNL